MSRREFLGLLWIVVGATCVVFAPNHQADGNALKNVGNFPERLPENVPSPFCVTDDW